MTSVSTDLSSFSDINFDFSNEDLGKFFNESFTKLEEGELITATVVDIGADFVKVNIGYKSQGLIPVSEFMDSENKLSVGINDVVEVFLESLENYEGQVQVSRDKAYKLRVWEKVGEICDSGDTIEGKIISKIKGGLVVDIGVKAFLPGSQVDLRPIRNLDKLIGEKFELKVLKFNLKRGNIVLSRRAFLEDDREDRRKKTIETLHEGALIQGVIKNITDYGVFIDLGGIDGLLHITDMTWGRIIHPTEMYNIGDEIEVMVLSYDPETEKVSLGLKQKSMNPWDNIMAKFKIGDQVEGKVVSIMNYGAFVEIEEGIEGLIHVSEMSWTKKVRHPSSFMNTGDLVSATIKDIDMDRKRISLSMRELQPNPWKEIAERAPVGTVVKGKIKNITEFGIFVEISDGIDGLVHVSDISWSQRIKKLSELFTRDQEVQVKILSIDVDKGRLSLGMKQLKEDPWKNLENEISIGDEVQGEVVHVADFGIFIEIKEGVEGLVHVSEIGKDVSKKKLLESFPIGKKIFTKVLKIDSTERRMGLTLADNESDSSHYEYTTSSGEKVEQPETEENSAVDDQPATEVKSVADDQSPVEEKSAVDQPSVDEQSVVEEKQSSNE